MAKILVVDDEIGIRELLSEILYDEGHTVEVAENAAQARAARNAGRPDLVLLDIWMPDIDGVSLLKEWSSQGLLTMPVIMMSGHATIDTAVEATRIGAINFLEKPITMQRLLKAVQAGLQAGERLLRGEPPVPPPSNRPVSPGMRPLAAAVPAVAAPVQESAPVPAPATTGVPPNQVALAPSVTQPEWPMVALNQPLREARDAFERIYFEHHLAAESGSMTRVADKTGLERTHLYRKLKQLGIDVNKRSRLAARG
ncbi:MAG: response regulator [Pigmentiphaga sp.]